MQDRFASMSLLVAVADAGSLSAGGETLGLSPPAVSRALAALEQRLGARLLERTTRRLRLTEAGERFLEHSRRLLAELAEAEAAVAGVHSEPRGTLRLTAPVQFGQLHVVPILLAFLDQHPALRAEALLLDRPVDLIEEGLDLAVRLGELPDSTLLARRIGLVRWQACAAPSYLQQHGVPRSPEELRRHCLVATGASAAPVAWPFSGGRVRLQPRLTVTSNAAALAVAVSGWGITRLPSYQVAEALASGQLTVLLEQHESAPWPVHVIHAGHAQLPAKVRGFADRLCEGLRRTPGVWPQEAEQRDWNAAG